MTYEEKLEMLKTLYPSASERLLEMMARILMEREIINEK